MAELVSIYAIDLTQTIRQTAQHGAEALTTEPFSVTEPFEDQQSAKWAKIIAALIFIIAIILMPTFFVDEDQPRNNSSSTITQAKRAG